MSDTLDPKLQTRDDPIVLARPTFGQEEIDAVTDVLRTGWVAQGPQVAEFEARFALQVGAVDAVATSNCTTALHLALIALGIGPGDEVVVPSLSFIATTSVVTYVGATPVFADVDWRTGNITAATVSEVLSSRTRAVIAVHQAGVPADVDELARVCDPLRIAIIEDAACAIGSTLRGAPIGSHGRLAAFSFHPRKVLTTGEGGMLAVSDPEVAQRLRRLREHGMNMSAAARHSSGHVLFEDYLEVGFNYRMTDIQAAIGNVQLRRLNGIVAHRRELAAGYQERLADLPDVRCVTDPPHGTTNYQSFWIELAADSLIGRTELLTRLARAGVTGRRGIMAAHLEPACARWAAAKLPVTERLASRTLILPLHGGLGYRHLDYICDVIHRELT